MKCLICGKEIDGAVICDDCKNKVSEELCYKVAQYDYKEPDNSLWMEIISELDAPFKFRDIALELAENVSDERKTFVIMRCMNFINGGCLGVPKRYRDFVIANAKDCDQNEALTVPEKNFVRALLLECYVSNYAWNLIGDLPDEISIDDEFLETVLILADYYMKVTDYENAIDILEDSRKVFSSEKDRARIDSYVKDIKERESGKKKAWRPSKREDIDHFNQYLEQLGVEYKKPTNNKKEKIKEADFKPFIRYEKSEAPTKYVAVWLTAEFYLKVNEVVEINAVRVSDGKKVDEFHSFVRPVNRPHNPKYVKAEEFMNAPLIKEIFPTFMEYIKNDILAIAGFDEQKKYLSRLARYSMVDHIDNEIFDVVEYGEDIADNFESYTRSSLLEKYGVIEGDTGMEKAKTTMELVEKMR